jgi:hypothetical protein
MEKETREAIERATQRARKLLEDDFASQLAANFDVLRSGTVAENGGSHLSPAQICQRDKIVAALQHKKAAGMSDAEAVNDYLRDAEFTTLNRFVALKMLEARELVQECISRGELSAGYQEFSGMAPGLSLLPNGAGYRLYVESLFDELSTEVKVLFDRRNPASVLWPRRLTFDALLNVLNTPDLADVWGEDETIGWVYQYFNRADERQAARYDQNGQPKAPDNSRELAVRNQFFTPRYVVRFLTDNTLGRIWVEMMHGNTVLVDLCKYLVCPPGEIHQSRRKKDPRDLRVLDPACGSGHFLLYAFDLLITIYEEAHRDLESPPSEATGHKLQDDYPSIGELRIALPGLVLAHNLHGVDIDPRCAQIAQLALWMRAQRAFSDLGVGRSNRTPIRRSNIVVAEPLGGGEGTLKEFLVKLDDAEITDVFSTLAETLTLAGDLGLLLRVEGLVQRGSNRGETGKLFAPTEVRIRSTLEQFIRESNASGHARRLLFSDDAVQGVGFLVTAEKKFDVVLMNPPFGDGTASGIQYLKQTYAEAANDLFSAFVIRGLELRAEHGLVGAITSRTGYFAPSLKEWRKKIYAAGLYLLADLGEGVMDAAMVEAAAYCIGSLQKAVVFRHLLESDKGSALTSAVKNSRNGQQDERVFALDLDLIRNLPDAPLAYWVPEPVVSKLLKFPTFEPSMGSVRKGLRTGDNFRFVRAHWEVTPDSIETRGASHDSADGWVPLVMTGASQPWFSPVYLVINWRNAGRELRAYVLKYGSESRLIQAKEYYFRPGFSWTLRAVRLFPYAIPPGCIFTGSRPMAFAADPDQSSALVSLCASRTSSAFLRFYGEMFARPKFLEGKLKLLPTPSMNERAKVVLRDAFRQGSSLARTEYQYFEPFLEFVAPRLDMCSSTEGGLTFDRSKLLPDHAEAVVRQLFGLTPDESAALERDLREALELADAKPREPEVHNEDSDADDESGAVVLLDSPAERARRIVSYAVGCLVGRWDVRLHAAAGTIERSSDEPLSAFPDGLLLLKSVGRDYPLQLWFDGIAVSDEGHPRDLVAGVDRVLELIGVDVTQVLNSLDESKHDLRIELDGPFFGWHLRTYSLGRRKAPLYWRLSVPSGRYSVWLYVQAFTQDTFFRVQSEYVAHKLAHEERRLEVMEQDAQDKMTIRARDSTVFRC